MKKIFLGLLLMVSFLGFSQKIKLKKGDVLVDGLVWLKYENDTFDCSVLNLNKEEIIFLKYIVQGPNNQVFSRDGEPNYFQISFLGQNKKIEIREFEEDILSILYSSKVVNEDGTLNPEKVDRLVEKYGTTFSDKAKLNTTNTVIIREEPRRSGVNINTGR
jgi:hypothetical protein